MRFQFFARSNSQVSVAKFEEKFGKRLKSLLNWRNGCRLFYNIIRSPYFTEIIDSISSIVYNRDVIQFHLKFSLTLDKDFRR